jgi:hypothetical protein
MPSLTQIPNSNFVSYLLINYLDVSQYHFIQNLMRRLMNDLSSSIIGALDVRVQNRLFLLILFLIILLLAYVSMWVPLVNSLTT